MRAVASLRHGSRQPSRLMGPQCGPWILPEAWKAPKQTGPSHTSLDGATGAAHRLHRPLLQGLHLDYDRPRSIRLTKEDAIYSSLRSDE
jgi:hypothetical protein